MGLERIMAEGRVLGQGKKPMVEISKVTSTRIQVPEEEFKSVLTIASLVFEAYKQMCEPFEAVVKKVKAKIQPFKGADYRQLSDEEHAEYRELINEEGEKLSRKILDSVLPQLKGEFTLEGYEAELSLRYSEKDILDFTKLIITSPDKNIYRLSLLSWEHGTRFNYSAPLLTLGTLSIEGNAWTEYSNIIRLFGDEPPLKKEE